MSFLHKVEHFLAGPDELVVPIKSNAIDSTFTIVLIIFGLAYCVQPRVDDAYRKGRAYLAWRAIEKRQTVEVTAYPTLAEICGVRGRWDAARVIAILLFIFGLCTVFLELQMDVAYDSGAVEYFFLQPPPVCKVSNTAWKVRNPDTLSITGDSFPGVEGNFGTGGAKAMYRIDRELKPIVYGQVRVAFWSEDAANAPTDLIYNPEDQVATLLEDLNCTSEGDTFDVSIEDEGSSWGEVTVCDEGPMMVGKNNTPPVIVLQPHLEGQTHVIVEERSTYPSFLYSVWKNPEYFQDGSGRKLVNVTHAFYIASTSRLAEAVVTEIVHAVKEKRDATGGGAFALVREFSSNNEHMYYDENDEVCGNQARATPFGENPKSEILKGIELSDVETIEKGVKVGTTGMVIASTIIIVSVIGFVWSLFLRSGVGMDIYDRDELIRAVALPESTPDGSRRSIIRIFVRKEDTGNVSVIVTDSTSDRNSCAALCKRGRGDVDDDSIPAAVTRETDGVEGAVVPAAPRTVWLEGVKTGMGRSLPGRDGNFRYPTSVSLSASPVPSNTGSASITPTTSRPSSPISFATSTTQMQLRGPSVMLDFSDHSNLTRTPALQNDTDTEGIDNSVNH